MTLEDFEKHLAADKDRKGQKEKHSHHSKEHNRKHHHKSHRHRDGDHDEHRHKRRRRDSGDDEQGEESRSHRRRRRFSATEDGPRADRPDISDLKRDSWMQSPAAIGVENVRRKQKEASPPRHISLGQDHEMKIHKKELNRHLKDLNAGTPLDELKTQDAKHDVDYTFGDSGSAWRMVRLSGVYRTAEESSRPVEEVALTKYANLREFDDAREEEIEMDRRKSYGKDYVGKEKPSGELYQERKLDAGIHREMARTRDSDAEFDEILDGIAAPVPAIPNRPDATAINKLKAQLLKAELKKDPNVDKIREEYEAAVAMSTSSDPTVISLSAMDNRMLSSAPRNEVKAVTNRRGQDRGNVEENEDMSIDDMVAEERRTRTQQGGEAKRFAERIAKDGKFDNDLEYMDENANTLAKRIHKSDLNLRNVAINDYQKISRILETCPLCHHEDAASEGDQLPAAPIVSLATRTFLSLPTKPELSSYSAMIVPLQHHTNLLECDDDEWEEIRNFMKSLTRFYHSRDTDVIFYENAAFPNRHPHAAMMAVPLPQSVGETSPAFFKEAFLSQESEWSQHKKIIDTEAKARNGDGRSAFRRSLAKEMPYFHVWFSLDGGLGHIVEEPDRWPKGDLFAREVIGGMLGLETEVLKKQGRWVRGGDRDRIESFRKRWRKFDWTRALVENS